mmetsp:Transcript_61890/g.73348  ORF Transcript_61890/g.73348 Transcript_61890/m.73348 type:complete len:87 (-) Transcript_61890:419-679(-)
MRLRANTTLLSLSIDPSSRIPQKPFEHEEENTIIKTRSKTRKYLHLKAKHFISKKPFIQKGKINFLFLVTFTTPDATPNAYICLIT